MDIVVEGDAQGLEPTGVRIDGLAATPVRGMGAYTRSLFVQGGVIVKVDPPWFGESVAEAELWSSMDPEDRPHFAEVLTWGWVRTPSGKESRSWVAMVYHDDFEDVRELDEEVQNEAHALLSHMAEKYELLDIASNDGHGYLNQIKRKSTTGQLLIHDYGSSNSV